MGHTVADLATLVGGELHGNGAVEISAVLPLSEATSNSLTFLSDAKHEAKLRGCKAGAVIAPRNVTPGVLPTILVDHPLTAVLQVAALFYPPEPRPAAGVDPRAAIHPTVVMGERCYVGPFARVEADVVLGDDCVIHAHAVIRAGSQLGNHVELHPHAVLYPRTIVGNRVVLHSGVVIGCDGFGYEFRDGKHHKIPQLGNVEIGDDVEIGAQSAIDRATIGSTRIGAGTKIDNHVMIGHNCQIGKHNIFVAQVGMAGSCVTEEFVVLAGKVGIADHVHIGAGAMIGANSGVFQDIPAGARYLGVPARPERDAKRMHLVMEKLPEMRRQLAEVRARLGLDERRVADDVSRPTREAG